VSSSGLIVVVPIAVRIARMERRTALAMPNPKSIML
jgi:hypothetical protein